MPLRWFEAQGKAGKAVGDKVHPQDLERDGRLVGPVRPHARPGLLLGQAEGVASYLAHGFLCGETIPVGQRRDPWSGRR
jgi:hypothetical protein